MMKPTVNIVGGGLSGCEAALALSRFGFRVRLYESKPIWRSKAHHSDLLAEVVCSNSFKSALNSTASGALKNELKVMGSALIPIAEDCAVPAGGALAVDRDLFSKAVTDRVAADKNIEIIPRIVTSLDEAVPTIVCAGPVCHDDLANELMRLTDSSALHFFDAAAPIITACSIDMSKAFYGARYDKGGADYINCPMNKAQYLQFYDALVSAERVIDKIGGVFEGCMPVEVMAARGVDALRYGPLRPVGFRVDGERPYAVVQLRRENAEGSIYNLVGFQTNLKFGEQKRVISLIPGLENCEIIRYGVMHRNTFINAPKVLQADLRIKDTEVYVAGQLCGVEGYVESMATGIVAAMNCANRLNGKSTSLPPAETVIGALLRYIVTPNSDFQPMNANFGIVPPITGVKKRERGQAYYNQSDEAIRQWYAEINRA